MIENDRVNILLVDDQPSKLLSYEVVLRDLGELKTHMRWIVGNGNEGKIQELEARIQRHEATLQRTAGLGLAFGIVLTILELALDSLRVMHPR